MRNLMFIKKLFLLEEKFFYYKKLLNFKKYKNINSINKNNFLNFIKQKVVSGVRFEVSGRLTRRLTASRSIFKYRYKGSLKNIHSSYNKLSSVMIRGHVKSNLQSTIVHSKTRNGAFGLKG